MRKQPGYLIYIIGLLPFIMVMGNSMFIPLIPKMQADLELTTVQSGWLLTGFTISAAFLVPFSGVLSDRYGRKRIALISLSLLMVGCIVSGVLGESFRWMLIGRILQGCGAGGVSALSMVLITVLYRGDERTRALGAIEVFNGGGKVASPLIGGFILAFSWYYSYIVFFVVALIAFTGILFAIHEQPSLGNEEKLVIRMRRTYEHTKQHWRWVIPVFASGGIGMFLLFGYLFYLSYLLSLEKESVWNGAIVAMPLIFLTITSYVTGRMLKKREDSYKRGFLYGILLMIIGTWSMILSMGISWAVIGMAVFSSGLGIVLPSANASLAMITSERGKGVVFSFYSMVRFLGVAFAPIFYGMWIADIKQMVVTSLFFVSVIALSILLSWTCFPIGKECNTAE